MADVQVGAQMPRLGTASEKGKPAVLLTVTKQPNTGTIELTNRLEATLKDLKKTCLPMFTSQPTFSASHDS